MVALALLLRVPVDEVLRHPRVSYAVSILRARKKYRAEEARKMFREIGRDDQMGVGRVLAILARSWVEG